MGDAFPVYVVDDDPIFRDWVELALAESNLPSQGFDNGEEFLAAVDGLALGCILLDMRMPRRTGLQVQTELRRRGVASPVIAMTGFGDVDQAVRSMKLGALDFLEKPFSPELLIDAIGRGFAHLRTLRP